MVSKEVLLEGPRTEPSMEDCQGALHHNRGESYLITLVRCFMCIFNVLARWRHIEICITSASVTEMYIPYVKYKYIFTIQLNN